MERVAVCGEEESINRRGFYLVTFIFRLVTFCFFVFPILALLLIIFFVLFFVWVLYEVQTLHLIAMDRSTHTHRFT